MSQSHKQKLTPELLANIADRRVRGSSWESVGAEFGWKPDDIRNTTWDMPEFELYLEIAQQSLLQEYQAQMLQTLGKQLNSTDEAVAFKAALALAKFISSQQRDTTRTKVEAMRTKVALARTQSRDTKTEVKANVPRTPEEKPRPTQQPQTQEQPRPARPTANTTPVTVSTAKSDKRAQNSGTIDLSLAPLG